ncbi:MAG: GntR family transcriptional regulator [Acidobacteria bacterium]|nr:GntR family transcriptional regulator [Acidobacteriota bacterium]MCI0717596.1 GntR family transcriptional regulator [Acidobacteriota bacterium]
MRAVFGKLTYTSLRGRIADEIQDAILNGTLREGERIVERKLADQFSASLTAVREALIELAAKGFVTKRPNCATHVIKFSHADVDKIFAFRRIVEAHTVEEACRAASQEGLERLTHSYKELLEAAHSKNAQLYLQRDLALHEVVWQISKNEYFEIALRRVVRPFFAFTFIRYGRGDSFDLVQDAYNHLAFVNPIRSRDAEAARQAYLSALDEWYAQTRSYIYGQGRESATPLIQHG